MVRSLNTGDSNDARFDQDGKGIYYTLASWNNNNNEFHHSSFDQLIMLSDDISIAGSYTETTTVTQVITSIIPEGPTGTIYTTASSFTVLFVMIGLIIATPTLSKIRHRKS